MKSKMIIICLCVLMNSGICIGQASPDSLFERTIERALVKGLTDSLIDSGQSAFALVRIVLSEQHQPTITSINQIPSFFSKYLLTSLGSVQFEKYFPPNASIIVPVYLVSYDRLEDLGNKDRVVGIPINYFGLSKETKRLETVYFARPVMITCVNGDTYPRVK